MKELEWSQHYTTIFQTLKESIMGSDRNSYSSIFYGCPHYLQERRTFIKKLKLLERSQISPIISLYAQGQLPDRILPNFELNRELMVVLVTCKNGEDPNKNEGAGVVTRKVNRQINRRTPARWVNYKLTL